jgi:hypothetical protein
MIHFKYFVFVRDRIYLVVLTTLQSFLSQQFREVVKDLQLTNSEDAYLARWLIGKTIGRYYFHLLVNVS